MLHSKMEKTLWDPFLTCNIKLTISKVITTRSNRHTQHLLKKFYVFYGFLKTIIFKTEIFLNPDLFHKIVWAPHEQLKKEKPWENHPSFKWIKWLITCLVSCDLMLVLYVQLSDGTRPCIERASERFVSPHCSYVGYNVGLSDPLHSKVSLQ